MIEIIPNWHPVFVHFTVALLSVSGVLFLIAFFAKDWRHRQAVLLIAEWNFWMGAGLTIATGLAGWHAYNTVAHDAPSHEAMTGHRNWALATISVVIVLAIWLWRAKKSKPDMPSFAFISVIVLLLALLGATAWHGGELVYRHGLGVMSLPKSEGKGHAHEHAAGSGHSDEAMQEQGATHHGEGHDHHEHGD